MKEPCTSEMLARPHSDPVFRPFSSRLNYHLSPASRTLLRRRGLRAVLAARKAAAEAPRSEADVASTQRRTTLPTGRRKQIQQVPSWMAWDRDALREQEEDLARFQVRISAVSAVDSAFSRHDSCLSIAIPARGEVMSGYQRMDCMGPPMQKWL